ncbi:MAG: hypothetical protein K6G69_06300 [Lachnospiraceae bacterium]|nr:hypothetical protein [Lachnospiraceae bacterium]
MMKSSERQELSYDSYKMNIKELFIYGSQGLGLICLFGYFFYRSVFLTILATPLILVYLQIKEKELCEKRKYDLQIQFKDALIAVNSSLKAGYSLENAFIESYKDMVMFYGDRSVIARELAVIKNGLRNNKSLTGMLYDMGRRSNISDIRDFSSVLIIGNRTGGNIGEIIESFIKVAEERVSVLEEIKTIISAKKFEQKIMNMVPFFIIFYIELTSKGFFNCLYDNIAGRIIMTICLCLYILSIYMSVKITDIAV